MASQENVKHLHECTVSNALGTWVFSVLGALVAIPLGIKRMSLGPLVFFGTTGTMLDIIIGVSQCEREHAKHHMKLLQDSQNATTGTDTWTEDSKTSSSSCIFLNKPLMYIYQLNSFQDTVMIPSFLRERRRKPLIDFAT